MYNSDIPTHAELPSSAQLIKSTIIAIAAAIVILVTIVLPSEYAIDPTGVGKMLNLTEMGEIKQQLTAEAEADRQLQEKQKPPVEGPSSSLMDQLFGLIASPAHAQSAGETWTDEVSFTLVPGEGIEIKLVMEKDAEAEYRWVARHGVVNFDLHGDGEGKNISYEKGRAVRGQEGVLTAAFTGNHGWFWRNRDKQDVTITLSVRGYYSELVRPN